ncbi:MAG TPA: HAD family hydrolase [Devosia sp.]|nr:HAD family hydrolase [Devosia sp.]
MIRAVLFDLDETLIIRAGAIRAFIAGQYERFASRLGGIDAAIYQSRFLDMEDNGRIAKDVLYPDFVAALGIKDVSAAELLEDYRAIYPSCAVLNDGAKETVEAIHARGLPLGVISNGNERVQLAKLKSIGLIDLLQTVVISEAVGLRKPDPAIFHLAADRLGIPPGETLYVGDNPEVDVVGAAQAGLQTAWFRNGQPWPDGLLPRADVDIDSLGELLHFPGK